MEKWNLIVRRERKLRGLSQGDLAGKLGCDARTIGRWERGEAFPSPYFIRGLTQVFAKDAAAMGLMEPDHTSAGRVEWGEAPDVARFFGREAELTLIKQWINGEQCRVITILGMGGCGKTTFTRVAAEQIETSFDYVFWYSLRDAPPLERFLERFFQFFPEPILNWRAQDINEHLSLAIDMFSRQRGLLIIDNVESILQGGQHAGQYLPGYDGYGKLFQRLGESRHHSCLLLTSRERLREVAHLEGDTSPVRSLTLPGLETKSGQLLLQDQELSGTATNWKALIRLYLGNPLALKLVSSFIRDLFQGDLGAFLAEEVAVFGSIHQLLDQQFQRLSDLEQDIMFWLAITREPLSLHTLHEMLAFPIARTTLFEAIESLRHRSMLQTNSERLFTLQPVIMEYIIGQVITSVYTEIYSQQLSRFGKYTLVKAQTDDYIRASQIRLILAPIGEKLRAELGERGANQRLRNLLENLQTTPRAETDYTAGNLFNLLIFLRANLRGLDGSHLNIRQGYFRGVDLALVNFSHADLSTCTFTDTFTCILCLAATRDGRFLAAGMTTGEVRIWRASDLTPLFIYNAHTEEIRSVAFNPSGELLASASEDHTIRLWETETGRCRAVLHEHTDIIRSVCFSADGLLLASASEDQTVRVWETATGQLLHTLKGHQGRVRTTTFHPRQPLLASGGEDGIIRFWEGTTGELRTAFAGQGSFILSLAFHPTEEILASGNEDHMVRLWNIQNGELLAVLEGHQDRVRALAISPDGCYLASGSDDGTIYLWNIATRQPLSILQGHTNRIWSLVFDAEGTRLVSSSEDDTLRWWEAHTGHCLRLLQGYTDLIKAISFSPDGQFVASGSEDRTIHLWNIQTGNWQKVLQGHGNRVRTLAISPNGQHLASGSEDETVRIWNIQTGLCVNILRGHTHLVRALAFNGSGQQLVSSGFDMRIHLWEIPTGRLLKSWNATRQGRLWAVAFHPQKQLFASGGDNPEIQIWGPEASEPLQTLNGHTHRIWSVAFSPNGNLLASCSDDLTIRLWNTTTWQCQSIIQGHQNWTRTIAFSPDSLLLASGSHDMTVRIWDINTGHCLHTLFGHTGFIWSVAFSPDGQFIASGSDDGTVRLWEIASGTCLRTLRRERPYEGMNITSARGLSDGQKTPYASWEQ